MKKIILILTFIFISISGIAQDYKFVKSMGGPLDDWASAIRLDAAGSIYSTGSFEATIDMDPDTGSFTLSTAGRWDVFISKFDTAGNLLWAKRIGAGGADFGNSIDVDSAGNVYVTGVFEGKVDFDPGIGIHEITGPGNDDIFVLKLDTYGNFLWAKVIGGSAGEHAAAITVKKGFVFITGNFSGAVDFDPGTAEFNDTAVGMSDIFILKLNAAGNFVWARKMGGYMVDKAYSIDVDANLNVYTTGSYNSIADFDPGAALYNLKSLANTAVFVSKLNASGNFVWARSFGGAGFDEGIDIKVSPSGDVYTTGYFFSMADFDPDTTKTYFLSGADYEIFISKLNSAGKFVWAKGMGGSGQGYPASITLDQEENIYSCGWFSGSTDFDPSASFFILGSAGDRDLYVSTLDSAGNFLGAVSAGALSADAAAGIEVDTMKNIYVAGSFNLTVDFDPGAGTGSRSANGTDAFILKLSPGCSLPDPPVFASGDSSVCPDGTGSYSIVPVAGATAYTWTVPLNAVIDTGQNTDAILVTFGKVSGDVRVSVSNSCGAGPAAPFTVEIVKILLQPAPQSILKGKTAFFTLHVGGRPTFYQWQIDSGQGFQNLSEGGQYTGTNNNVLEVSDLRLSQSGHLFRAFYNFAGCQDTGASAKLTVYDNVGLQEEPAVRFNVYPNPATTEFILETASKGGYTLADISGRELRSGTLEEGKTTIDVSNLAAGIYFVRAGNAKPVMLLKQ